MLQPQRAAGGRRISGRITPIKHRHGQAVADADADPPCNAQRISQHAQPTRNLAAVSMIRLDRLNR